MAKPEYTEMKPEDLTEEQIMQLAQWANLLNEENKNLKGYIVQLQAQLQNARGQRAVAEHHFNRLQDKIITVKTAFDEQED
jgi:predicted nuclease with TOPRIM domain